MQPDWSEISKATQAHLLQSLPHTLLAALSAPANLQWAQESAYITGDFWHARGALPVEPLNAILREFESWRQPTLMLVGNHDQVSVGGLDHALQPLAAACSAIHIVDVPTLYR